MAKVSVIIPVFNTGIYLESSIGSIQKQTLEDIEIICVNDGSADDSLQILEKLAQKDPRIQILDQINQGQSTARNAAMRQATGEYVYFMDSDDLVTSRMLEELCAVCDREKLDVVFFSGASFYESEELEKQHKSFAGQYARKGKYPPCMAGPDLFYRLKKNKEYYVSPCLQLIRRDFLTQRGITFYEGIIHEDNLFTFQVILSAVRAGCVQDVYFYRRLREESVMTRREDQKNLRGYYVCMLKTAEFAGTLTITDKETADEIDLTVSRLNYHVHRIYGQLTPEEKEAFLRECTPFERCSFRGITRWDIWEVGRAEKKGRENVRKAKETMSFRLGNAILTPAKLARKIYRSVKKNGAAATWKKICGKLTGRTG